jgi:2-C-methyl-D-erythritol 2,4-cyclodiphosphate synthase
VDGRQLILGGVNIPSARGLLGHSDADVLLHAICDALLGAAGLGDIGRHFPDTDERYRGISSVKLLVEVRNKMNEKGLRCGNIDAVIVAQQPKMAPYLDRMRDTIAAALQIGTDAVTIKATTTEGMGFEGRGEGIAAQAVTLVA